MPEPVPSRVRSPSAPMPLETTPHWLCLPFTEVPPVTLYRALGLRSRVFVVEQQCIYQDLDGSDLDALIVVGSLPRQDLPAAPAAGPVAADIVATARVLPPGARFPEPSIGRVCTAAAFRRRGLGRLLMEFTIGSTRQHHPGLAIRISAQAYLQAFYESLGFQVVSPAYLEDGIPHLEMRLPPG